MKFSTREDIDAPMDVVFRNLTNFEYFERQAMRRGAVVQRTDKLSTPGVGMSWTAKVKYRGRNRKAEIEMIAYAPDEGFAVFSTFSGVQATTAVELVALSKSKTRMMVGSELKPKTLSARVFLQSLKLAKGSLDKRFKRRVSEFAAMIGGGKAGAA